MKTTFTAAGFVAVAVAAPSPSKLNNSPAFIDFMAKNNKQYVSTKQLLERAGLFAQAENEVRALNVQSERSGRWNAAKFECNFLSDMTKEEKKSMRGYISKDPS